MGEQILTRFLVLSDTHTDELHRMPEVPVDVLIHCGDLTEDSRLAEFRKMADYIRTFNAPLKLVIAGNHDFTLDTPYFKKKINQKAGKDYLAMVKRNYGDFGEAKALFESEEAKSAGIVYLEEGVYSFELANGASLKVYASPYTKTGYGWGFSYGSRDKHNWLVPQDVDIVVTHGPPRGIFDRTWGGSRVGVPELFAAVARARPQMHCFGHIHESWGAKLCTWHKETSEAPSHSTDIDDEQSQVIETLSSIKAGKSDSPEDVSKKELKWSKYKEQGYCSVPTPPKQGSQTVFVNAAIKGENDDSQHLPWIVDLKLPRVEVKET